MPKSGPHPYNKLNVARVKAAKPGRHADGNGLYLVVDPSGARRWLLRTVVRGRRRDIGLGSARLVSLAEARVQATDLRRAARQGRDPIQERDRAKRFAPTFEEAARRVHGEQVVPTARNAKHTDQWVRSLELYAFPMIGTLPVDTIDQADILKVLTPIWTDKPETARRIRQRLKTVMDWARAAGHCDKVNPVEGIQRGLAVQRASNKHHKAAAWQDMPKIWKQIDAVDGMGRLALQFTILTAGRSGEIRGARWDEIDFETQTWSLPGDRMKSGRDHRVPLSPAAMAILKEARRLDPHQGAIVFPSRQTNTQLSDMTLSAVLKRIDLDVTVHGFRSTFRDWSEEATSFPHEVKEAALAHVVKNKAEAAYRRTDLFEKRRKLMDEWGKYVVSNHIGVE